MAGYQSIFTNGNFAPATKTNPLVTGFVPGQYAKVNAQIAAQPKFNVNSVNDVPTLNAALHAGHINSGQWMQRFKQIQSTAKGLNSPQTVGAPKESLFSATGQAEPQAAGTLFNTVKSIAQFTPQQVVSVAHSILPSHSSIPAQTLQTIQKLPVSQRPQAISPATRQVLQNAGFNINDLSDKNINNFVKQDTKVAQKASSVTPKGNLATALAGSQPIKSVPARVAGSQQALATGIHIPIVNKTVHATGTLGNVLANVGVASQVAGGLAPVEGAVETGGRIASKATVALGKDEATNTLINSQKIASAGKQANLADRLGTSSVKEATTPKTTAIPVAGESSSVTGKVTPKPSDTAYIKASNKLSDQYEKELVSVQKVPHPVTQKVLQTNLDTKYNTLQQKLDDSYGKSSVSFKGKPTIVKSPSNSTIPEPRSPLTQHTPVPFDSTRIPEPEVDSTLSSKESPATPKTATEQTPGTKVSGSALNSEQRAVEKGLASDLGEKATYSGGSYKHEASKAVSLANDNPDEAMKIATGTKPGDNVIHEVAVRRAVESKALQSGDVDTLTKLAQSSQHSATSEAAQRLGSESFNAVHNSPVKAIRDIQESRQKALLSGGEKTPEKVLASTVRDIQKTAAPKLKVSRQDWHSFINDLQCK